MSVMADQATLIAHIDHIAGAGWAMMVLQVGHRHRRYRSVRLVRITRHHPAGKDRCDQNSVGHPRRVIRARENRR